jgi:hypothetical protein
VKYSFYILRRREIISLFLYEYNTFDPDEREEVIRTHGKE